MTIRLRSATAEDAGHIAAVYLESRKVFLPFAPLAHSEDEVQDWISTTLIPQANVTVAEDENQIIGMISTSTINGISWIDHFYLSPDFTGREIGSRMLKAAMEDLALPIRLYCFQENIDARRFYERHAFRAIAMTDGTDNEEKCPDVLYELSSESVVDFGRNGE